MVTHDTQRFIGRAAELDTLLQHVAGLRLGAPPQRCLINACGVHGIGKSALLAALRQRAAGEAGLRTLSLELPPLPPAHKAPTLEARQAILRQLAAEVG
ncbi:MAG: ATP-binding protein, partial [Chloroflexales bacterium]|nr:ATP-binding protein [Chloroflexales bacterium]